MQDFMKHLFSSLGDLSKKEIDLISKTIKSEIKRRYDKDNDFRELVKIPVVRRSLNSGIETLENAPRNIWTNFAKSLEPSSDSSENSEKDSPKMRSVFQNWSKNIISWVRNIFPTRQQQNMPRDVYKVIDDLKDYTKLKNIENTQKREKEKEINEALRDPEKLVTIVKNALRTLLFDQYTHLDEKKRKLIQQRLQSFWMDPNSKTEVEIIRDKKRNQKHQGHTTITEHNVRMRTTKKHSKTRNRHKKKKRFEIKHTTRQTRTPKHSWSASDEGQTYQNILRMKPETKGSQTSLRDTEEDAIKHTEEKTEAHTSTKTTPSEISNEHNGKSIEWSSERTDHSSEEQQTTTSRTFETTGTSPQTEKLPKKSTTKKPKKHKPKQSVESESEDSGYLLQSKNKKRIRESKKKTTTERTTTEKTTPEITTTEKTTTTTITTTTRRTSRTTIEQTSLESQSAEKSTTTEKSLMDSLREIIADDQKPLFEMNEKESSKETKEVPLESSKEKPKIARETKPKKKQSEEEKRNISKNKSKLESKSEEENRSDTEKESKEKHINSKNLKPLKNKQSKEKKLDALESWSEVETKEQQKNDEKTQKKESSSNETDKKRSDENKEQVRDITKENKSEYKMDGENKSDFHRKKKKEQVVKPESDEEYDPKLALRMPDAKKQKSKKVKEKATTTQTTNDILRTKGMFPHARVIEENIAKISVVKEDEVFTDHSEEKKRAKQIRNNLNEKKNEEHKNLKITETENPKGSRINRAMSEESSPTINATPSRNAPTTDVNFYLNNVQKVHNNQRALNEKTTDTIILNSKLAPYNKEAEISHHNKTIQTARFEKPANIGNEKLDLSAESEALFRALEEQERKHGIDNLLDNSDLIDLQNLNISFYTTSSKGRSIVTLSHLPTNDN